MSLPKSARRRPWLWIGVLAILAAGVSIAGASRKASAHVPEIRSAPTATSAASDGNRDSAGAEAHADQDVCSQQLD